MGGQDTPDFSLARVLEVRRLSDRVLRITLSGPADFLWTPGQHVAVSARPSGEEPSYYSIASAPTPQAPGRFDLAVSETALRVGALLSPDSEIWLSRAGGGVPSEFLSAEELVLVGMGTGVAPLRSIVHAATNRAQRITLVQGARRLSDCLFFDEFQELRSERFEYRPVLSGKNEGWAGRLGRVQLHLENLASSQASFCVCGSRAMVEEVRAVLLRSGALPESIFGEGYS